MRRLIKRDYILTREEAQIAIWTYLINRHDKPPVPSSSDQLILDWKNNGEVTATFVGEE